MDVVAQPPQTIPILDRDTLEATLEKSALFLAVAIETIGENALEPTHSFA